MITNNKLTLLALAVSFSLFSGAGLAGEGDDSWRDSRYEFDPSKGRINCGSNAGDERGTWTCVNDGLTYLNNKTKDFSTEKLTEIKEEAIKSGQDAANKARQDANNFTDNKVTASNSRTDGLISQEQKARTDALNAEKLAREQGDADMLKNANQYTDNKVTASNSRTDGLISKEQQARTDALNAEKLAREQGDADTLKNANKYTNFKIQENNELLSADIDQARNDFDSNLKTTKSTLENNIFYVNQTLTNNVNRTKRDLSDNLDKTRSDLSANIIASQNDSNSRTDKLINQERKSREQGDADTLKNANQYTDNKVTASNSRTDSLISKEQQARTDALATEKSAREQGDKDTLKSANHYTDHRIGSLGSNVSNALNDFQQKTQQQFNQVNTQINTLNKKVDRGLASSSAIAGLFQPYGVGKFNFTAGIGTYGGESAIAVGTGYRFNENVAIKAGVSSPSGDMKIMTNTSINLEW
ncbi:YadA domain-containing protein [Yersinia enterocolitica]|uniref:YadA-like family protein n=1 Tax=Yersinia enterocolitica TaxID=630 RepID=UPI0005E1BAB3|nr:YadA-like family protein [Yersinia enterocolitica]CQQ96739.1 YadA domain-containing protein [Yersinia enterocolitica]